MRGSLELCGSHPCTSIESIGLGGPDANGRRASSTGTASPSAEDGFVGLVYVNQEAGYTFHYPNDWVVVEGKGAGSVVVYAPPATLEAVPRT